MSNLAAQRSTITADAADRLIDAIEAHAKSIGLPIVTVVVDESGVLKAMRRMDGAALVAIGAAHKKALTAVGFGMATGQPWLDFMKSDPILVGGIPQLPDFILLGGGSPLKVDGAVVGAVGVSGGHYHQDESCVAAGLKALGFS